jgi:hypothetical protein
MKSCLVLIAQVLYIDLDAHQGNGVERDKLHFDDKDVFILDAYNRYVQHLLALPGWPPSYFETSRT